MAPAGSRQGERADFGLTGLSSQGGKEFTGGSLAGQIANANNLPFSKTDIVLDSVPTPAAIERSLTRLEALARERGIAVGVAAASPASIDRIALWAKALDQRGVSLVPITAVTIKPKSS